MINADFQYEEIEAKLNYCGPQGEKGDPGPSDLSNFVQTPINITSLYDDSGEETQTSHIQLKTFGYQTNDEYAEIKLEGDSLQLKAVSDSTPARSGLTISADGLYATVLGSPAYENAQMNFQNTGLRLKTYSEDPISYETNQHVYQFEEGFGKVQNYGSGPFRVLNLRANNNPPEEQLESWYPQANWPVGMSYLNTTKKDLYFLTDLTTAYDPDYGEDMTTLYWQKIPAHEVLWDNPDKASAFLGQDVTVPSLDNYRWIMMEFGRYSGATGAVQYTTIVPTDFTIANAYMINTTSTKVQFLTRNVAKTSSTKIHFYSSTMNAVTVATGVWDATQTDLAVLIPLRIIGIK